MGLGGLTKSDRAQTEPLERIFDCPQWPSGGFCALFSRLFFIGHSGKKIDSGLCLEVALNVNLFWTILNLLPVFPLDGGHLMRIIIGRDFRDPGVEIGLFYQHYSWPSCHRALFFCHSTNPHGGFIFYAGL